MQASEIGAVEKIIGEVKSGVGLDESFYSAVLQQDGKIAVVVAELFWLQSHAMGCIPRTFYHCSCRHWKRLEKKADSRKEDVGSPKNQCEKSEKSVRSQKWEK